MSYRTRKRIERPEHFTGINKNHAFADNLIFAGLGGVTDNTIVDAVSGLAGINQAPSLMFDDVSDFGRCIKTSDAFRNTGILFGNPTTVQPTEEISIILGLKYSAAESGNHKRIISKGIASGNDSWGIKFDGSQYPYFFTNGDFQKGNALVKGANYTLCCTYKSGQKRIYENGILIASSAKTGAIITAGELMLLASDNNDTNKGFRGELYYVGIFNKVLPSEMALSLHQNDAQIWEEERYWVPDAAASGSATSVNATTQSLVLTNNNTTVNASTLINTSIHALTVTENPAVITINSGVVVNSTNQALVIAEKSATVNVQHSVSISTQSLLVTGNSTSINASKVINTTVQSILVSENNAAINAGKNISATVDALSITENQAVVTVISGININATTDSLLISESPATVNNKKSISASTNSLTLTENNVAVGIGANISATVQLLVITEAAANVNAQKNINVASQSISLSENNAVVSQSRNILASTDSFVITNYAATVKVSANIQATSDAITLSEFNASVKADKSIQAGAHTLTMTARNATVILGDAPSSLHDDGVFMGYSRQAIYVKGYGRVYV